MTATEPTPAERAKQIRERIDEIAPWPAMGSKVTAEGLARWLAVHAQREWVRSIAPFTEPGGPEVLDVIAVAKLNAQFAAARALLALIGTGRETQVAQEIAAAWNDGGEVGVWLYEHLRHLGIDVDEITRLEQERMALLNARAGSEEDR